MALALLPPLRWRKPPEANSEHGRLTPSSLSFASKSTRSFVGSRRNCRTKDLQFAPASELLLRRFDVPDARPPVGTLRRGPRWRTSRCALLRLFMTSPAQSPKDARSTVLKPSKGHGRRLLRDNGVDIGLSNGPGSRLDAQPDRARCLVTRRHPEGSVVTCPSSTPLIPLRLPIPEKL